MTKRDDRGAIYGHIDRLVNFSDAVIAIAVTLLVLPLVDRAADVRFDSFTHLYGAVGQEFWIFLISFVVICRFWLVHYRLFRSLKSFDGAIFWLNAWWLLSIVLTPFPTELIGRGTANNSMVAGIYIGNLLLTAIAGILIEIWVRRHPYLQKPDSQVPSILSGLVAVGLIVVALIVAVVLPAVGPWSLLLLLATDPVMRLLRRLFL